MPSELIPDPNPRGERNLIAAIKARLQLKMPLPVPFGDDMAGISGSHPNLLWTTDMLMDGIDFDSTCHPWKQIGRKAMAVNLSDCAAMAATPIAALCAVALNNSLAAADALELSTGVIEQGAEFNCPLVGGDTNSWHAPTVISITVAAECCHGQPVRRDGALPGDSIFVSGPLGGSILGRHLTPRPRIELATALLQAARPHAMIDISDGLSTDLAHICGASGCGAALQADSLERAIHPDARKLAERDGIPALVHALQDGEDFELIVVAGPELTESIADVHGLIRIGRVTSEPGVRLQHHDGSVSPGEPRGWEHFK